MKKSGTSGTFMTVEGTSLAKIVLLLFLFLFTIFSVSGLITSMGPEYRISSSSVNLAAQNVNGKLLYQLMGWENHHFLKAKKDLAGGPKLTSLLFSLSTNLNLNDPRSLLGRELPGFYQFDGHIVVAGEGTNYTNMPIESAPPEEIIKAEQEASLQNLEGIDQPNDNPKPVPPSQTTGNKKVVLIYFTHTHESYLPYLKGVTDPNLAIHSKINVTHVGDELKQSLESRGIGTLVNKTDVIAMLNKNGLSYPKAYMESRQVVEASIGSDHNLQYFIDIHRDSRRKNQTTIMLNGKSYAKLAFIIGAENPNYEKNEKFATALHNLLEKKYPGLSRGVIKKQGAGNNGKYNQDLSQNAVLIEFGGVDNTFDELNRSANALADVFGEYFWKAEKVNGISGKSVGN